MSTTPVWEVIGTDKSFCRTRTPTGWLVQQTLDCVHIGQDQNEYITSGYDWRVALTFVPDPDGVWLKEV